LSLEIKTCGGKGQSGDIAICCQRTSFETERPTIIPEWAEITFDAQRIANANLDVIFRGKAGILVETFTFEKGGANGVKRLLAFMTLKPVKVSNNSAIESAKQPIGTKRIGWQFRVRLIRLMGQVIVSLADQLDIPAIQQVQAESQINDSANHRRLI
jgi:hypothetical protein